MTKATEFNKYSIIYKDINDNIHTAITYTNNAVEAREKALKHCSKIAEIIRVERA